MASESIPFGKPLIGEEEHRAAAAVLAGPTLTHGPRVKEFEQAFAEFTASPYSVATATCMASLHLAYLAIDLAPGDEVIVPAQTHVAMAHAVEICGATPVFCDCEADTGNIDLEQLESLIGEGTRAISIVHYLGLPVDMDPVLELARGRGIFVVEDCAIALGARKGGTHVGLLGDIGCFSFYPVKHITTCEGGMVITRHEEIAERVAKQRAFGIDRSVLSERPHSGAYDVELLGLNYRLGEIGGAIGIEQLKKLPAFLEARRRNYRRLAKALRDVEGLDILDSDDRNDRMASHYCLVARLDPAVADRREQVMADLRRQGVGTSVYYPKPLPDTAYYAAKYGQAGRFPEAARISYGSLAFPVGPHLSESDVDRIAEATTGAMKEVTG